MPQNEPPVAPKPASPAQTSAKPAAKPPEATDAGHVPITEEFDRAKWTLPPVQVVVIALVIVAVIVGAIALWQKPAPPGTGSIDDVAAAQTQDNQVLVAITLTMHNGAQKPLWIQHLKAKLTTDTGNTMEDTAASPVDFDRYFEAFPELKQHSIEALRVESKILPGNQARGTIIVSFPVTKEVFDKRKAIAVIIEPYDQWPITLTK